MTQWIISASNQVQDILKFILKIKVCAEVNIKHYLLFIKDICDVIYGRPKIVTDCLKSMTSKDNYLTSDTKINKIYVYNFVNNVNYLHADGL